MFDHSFHDHWILISGKITTYHATIKRTETAPVKNLVSWDKKVSQYITKITSDVSY